MRGVESATSPVTGAVLPAAPLAAAAPLMAPNAAPKAYDGANQPQVVGRLSARGFEHVRAEIPHWTFLLSYRPFLRMALQRA